MKVDLFEGDCLKVMDELIEKKIKINLTVTSPPYFNLRNYTDDNIFEIGKENCVDKYIENLIQVFKKVYDLTDKNGSCYINIGDTYDKYGSLLCVPDKLKIAMISIGWICRNEIIWHKPNAIPNSAKNRFTNDFEKIYFFTKSKKYNFNTQYEDRKTKISNTSIESKKSKYDSIKQETEVRQGMNKKRGSKIIEVRNNLPEQQYFVKYLRSKTNPKLLNQLTNIKLSKIEHWFRKDESGFAYPSVIDWNLIKPHIMDNSLEFNAIDYGITKIDYETDDINKNSHKGRLKRTTWSINTKPSSFKHFASFPEELIETPIKASSNRGDIVFDPFLGSGTTGVVSKRLNRNFIGVELNSNYLKIAKERIKNESNINL